MTETYINYICDDCGAEWRRTIDRGMGDNSDLLSRGHWNTE
ncbi:MAG: hypothetical protein WD359_04285 [Dehalococcoidia bacterium]